MPIQNYGVLKGRPIGVKFAAGANDHYQVHIIDDTTDYRIAINVKSQLSPPDLEYIVIDNFSHPILSGLPALSLGFTSLPSKPNSSALDFIRGNLFKRTDLKKLAASVPGANNDLNELIDKYIQRSMSDEDTLVYAFGQRWGPEKNKKDKYFGFLPGNGIHDIHMNQGNSGQFAQDNGSWQDGGLIIHFANQWVALFFKFQSQTWHSEDDNGEPIVTSDPEGSVLIIAALVNPVGDDPSKETVTLLNTSPTVIDLKGWTIADKNKNKQPLTGILDPGAPLQVKLTPQVQLGNKGGLITLLNKEGLKVSGVSYTAEQAKREGWTLTF